MKQVERTVWTGIGAVAATLVVGFGFAGWVTGGTAEKMANEAANAAHDQLAAAVCAEQFLRAANARERLAKLQSLEWWERDDKLAADGWATMPGETEPALGVPIRCATRLSEHAEALAKATPVSAAPKR
jgi:hypothetical protein